MDANYGPILALILGNAAFIIPLFLWNRAEARSDMRHMDAKLDSNRELIRTVHQESKDLIMAIQAEMKDFHGRLCAIEERGRK